MSNVIRPGKNPFFVYDMHKICIVCNHKLIAHPTYSVFEELPQMEPKTNVLKALELVSNFKKLDIDRGHPRICSTCYIDTIAALKFWKKCEKSVALLEFYLEHQNQKEDKNNLSIDNSAVSMDIPLSPEESTLLHTEIVYVKTEPGNHDSVLEMDNEESNDNYGTLLNNIDYDKLNTDDGTKLEINDNKQSNNTKNKEGASVDKVPCKVCFKLYRSDYVNKHYLRVHTGERRYSCKNCDKRYKGPMELKMHMRTAHSDTREYLCNICGKSFKLQSLCYSHIKLHSDERPHKCKICGKGFKALRTLTQHTVVHSDEKAFTCEVCCKSFSLRKHLRQHMISHQEVKRHQCRLCGNLFTQAHSLKTHLSNYCKGGSSHV